jgi:hypothetical protein
VPGDGRELIDQTLRQAGVNCAVRAYPCEHAFMRDEGPRYDPEATDQAFGDMIGLFRSVFGQLYLNRGTPFDAVFISGGRAVFPAGQDAEVQRPGAG